MAANNLRIIYQNIADAATITASSTAGVTSTNNLKKDSKSSIWRSQTSSSTAVKANLVATFDSSIIGGVILPFCNLTSVATIRVRGFTGAAPILGGTVDTPTISTPGTLIFDTGNIAACPYQQLGLWGWGTLPLGVNAYSYGGGTYARVWFPHATCTSIVVEIIDTNASKYVEAARLVIGAYWSPKYNTEFGLTNGNKDMSTSERSQSGDLITNRGALYNSLNFDLNWLTPSDRLDLTRILKGNGLTKPLFVSLFPDNSTDWAKEQSYQIYGKLSDIPAITHPIHGIYSASIDIEEV